MSYASSFSASLARNACTDNACTDAMPVSLDAPDDALEDPLRDCSDKPQEACGVFGAYAPTENVAKLAYFGLFALQHRGQESAGIATFDGTKLHSHKDMGLVSQVFNEEILENLPGTIVVGHNRYSTTGSSRICNAQPAIVETRLGTLALAHNGNLVNSLALRDVLMAKDHDISSSTDSELIAIAMADAVNAGQTWCEAAVTAFQHSRGAFSLVIGTPEGIIGARDPNGIRPLVIGVLKETTAEGATQYVLASETCALDIIGATYLRDVEPGELVWITPDGLQAQRWVTEPEPKLCIFELIYFARPDSVFHGESLYTYRLRLGKQLAEEHPIAADLVMGVPDSGIPAAIGYAEVSGIAYMEGLIKNRYVGRTFIQPTQSMREDGIRMKLNPLRDVLQGKRVVVVDDSIVRGTTSRKLVYALRKAGAKEVHMRISSPPVTHPCFYGIDTDNQDQLVAANLTLTEIAENIGVDSLGYLSIPGMLKAAQDDDHNFCKACFNGDYPVEIPERLKRSKLKLETVYR